MAEPTFLALVAPLFTVLKIDYAPFGSREATWQAWHAVLRRHTSQEPLAHGGGWSNRG
ncbi:hypothetical protein [Streptomyces monomycini]|uniref:hypothetical protein n=1 Tax=Streptomyces monomycini TaxID=371720 RepID=UPI000A6074E7|nr:hypothetical protein [Streptomyces monomycini]